MKVLSINSARSIWLVPTKYLNPRGVLLNPAVHGIIDRYKFSEKLPQSEIFEFENKSLELKAGTYVSQDDMPIEVSLAVHSDGIVAETRSSNNDSDLFLEDAFTFLSDNFGLTPYTELPINKKYVSEIYFTLKNTPNFFSELTDNFVKKSSSLINSDNLGEFHFQGIHLATDPGLSRNPSFIRVEREINVPLTENRFFSSGSIKTEEHIELLEMLETVEC